MPHDVALFITCLTDQFHPHVGIAATQVLEHFGCRVRFPDAQTCCGQPFFNNGFHDQARELAKRFIEVFEQYDYIVTPSASCCAMVREQFHQLLDGDHAYEHGLERVTSRTYELIEFLDQVLKVDLSKISLPSSRSVTYHYNCHLRSLGISDRPMQMLQQIGNVNFVPLARAEQCCGFGGTFAVKYPAISRVMVEDKADCIAASKAEVTVVNDAGCAMNIAGMCHKRGMPTRVTHMIELIAEALGLDVTQW